MYCRRTICQSCSCFEVHPSKAYIRCEKIIPKYASKLKHWRLPEDWEEVLVPETCDRQMEYMLLGGGKGPTPYDVLGERDNEY